jgi:hypothetical protein
MPPWYEFVEVSDEPMCMAYCNNVVLNDFWYSECTPSTSTGCTGVPDDDPNASSAADDFVGEQELRASVRAARREARKQAFEAAGVASGPAGDIHGRDAMSSSYSANGGIEFSSRQWMWNCLSTPSASSGPMDVCANSSALPSDVTMPALEVTLATLNNLKHREICAQSSVCGPYNGNCCENFIGAGGPSSPYALDIASEYCGGDQNTCYSAVSSLFACAQVREVALPKQMAVSRC